MRGNYQVRFLGGRGAAMSFSPTQQHYQGLGGRRYIGNPKQPTVTVCQLINGVYQTQLFRRGESLDSPQFPTLSLTTTQLFDAGT
ncbi:MAG: hypothetical protein F6K00_28535 [Leptolyngbya sp. SIOISBB]|nr:hypothetical protein [Leptolyngbya sp. SIOISBB]